MRSVKDYFHRHSSDQEDGNLLKPRSEEKRTKSECLYTNVDFGLTFEAGQKDAQCQANLCDAPALWELDNFNLDRLKIGDSHGNTVGKLEGNSIESRSLVELTELLHCEGDAALQQMSEAEIISLINAKSIPAHKLETLLGDELKAVHIRRLWLGSKEGLSNSALRNLPYKNYDFSMVSNQCCENVLGYMPVPVGYAGPVTVNGTAFYIPLATTEGCLVASTNRGCRAIMTGSGVRSIVYADAMTRGPCLQFEDIDKACEFIWWTEKESHFSIIKQTFEATSRYAKLKFVKCRPAGNRVFLRFGASTGDAMGMNIVTKGTETVLSMLRTRYFPNMVVVSLSGNYCVDKKPAALNWIEGRGKSVVAEAVIPSSGVSRVLKTDVDALVTLSTDKNLLGSAMAGAMGGFNAHSANIVTAMFIATGQDPAQSISSSNCVTLMSKEQDGSLRISCTMPSLEVGTVGGGTILPPQMAALQMLGCAGGNVSKPGANAHRLAEVVCACVLAGELSLLAALAEGNLVKSHLKHNRSSINLREASSSNMVGLGGVESAIKLAEKSMKATGLDPSSCSKIL